MDDEIKSEIDRKLRETEARLVKKLLEHDAKMTTILQTIRDTLDIFNDFISSQNIKLD